jgi:hypothetical protein
VIPKKIHRIWLGSEVPAEFEGTWATWRTTFPDYELFTWTESNLRELGMPEYMWSGLTYAEQSDVARLRVLNRCGGIYADCDMVPLRRFDDLWTPDDRIVAFETPGHEICTGLIAGAVGAFGFIEAFTERNARRVAPDAAPNVRTGPYAFAAALDYVSSADVSGVRGIRLYPPSFVDLTGSELFAVVRTRFRDPAVWAPAMNPAARARSSGVKHLLFELRLLPLRARRVLARVASAWLR